ncbi:unnamed protein product [Meganyctiphanes norvegica]|uniref:CHK kinase-like domain-containing protein n=1 Tax=Meganyctiphanes norvegica TaxID=48144 RepID=A0AAV2Q6Q9_MEGNR
MKAPKLRSQITKEWVEYILNDYENRENLEGKPVTVTVKTYETNDVGEAGAGYVGDMVKLLVNVSVNDSSLGKDAKEDRKYNLCVKLMNPDPGGQIMHQEMGINFRELIMYSSAVTALNKFQEKHSNDEYRLNIPKFIYGKWTEKEFVLVMENVKVNGFNNVPKKDGLNLQQAKAIVENLAKLHAVSYAYTKSNNFLEKFPCYENNKNMKVMNDFGMGLGIDLMSRFLKTQKDKTELANKLKVNKDAIVNKLKEYYEDVNKHKITCLIHGDAWSNNFMFKEISNENDGQTFQLQMVDWQMTYWNTPTIDLQYLLTTSTTGEFRRTHLDDVLRHYHATFTTATTKMGAPLSNWNFRIFKSEYERASYHGILKGLFVVLVTQSETGTKFQEISQSHQNSKVKKTLLKMTAKAMIPIMHSSIYTSMMDGTMIHYLGPIVEEMKSGKNKNLVDRVMDIVNEADEKGLFDVDSIRPGCLPACV